MRCVKWRCAVQIMTLYSLYSNYDLVFLVWVKKVMQYNLSPHSNTHSLGAKHKQSKCYHFLMGGQTAKHHLKSLINKKVLCESREMSNRIFITCIELLTPYVSSVWYM